MTDPSMPQGETDIWRLKPWWCQPWSIVLSGLALIGGSRVVLPNRWVTLGVTVLVGLWWWIFLLLVPRQYRAWVEAGDNPAE